MSADDSLRDGMTAIWVRSLPHIRQQLEVLEQAAGALQRSELGDDLRIAAVREAHRLAGSTGSFGFQEASRAAFELETILENEAPQDAARVSELVSRLRQTIDTEELP